MTHRKVLIKYSFIKSTYSIEKQSEPRKNFFFQDFPAVSDQQTEKLQDDWRAQVSKSLNLMTEGITFLGTFHGRVFALDVTAGPTSFNHHLGCFQ